MAGGFYPGNAGFLVAVEEQSLKDGAKNAPGHRYEGQKADNFSEAAVAVLDPLMPLQPIHHKESSL